MRAMMVQEPKIAAQVAEEDEVLSQDPNKDRKSVV